MADALPTGVTRSDVEAHIREYGVTVCKGAKYIPPPTYEEAEKLRRELAEAEATGTLRPPKGDHWRDRPIRDRHGVQVNAAKRARIRDMVRRGYCAAEIARELNCWPQAVSSMLRRMGIKARPGTNPARVSYAELGRLRQEGWTHRALAAHFKVSTGTIWRRLRELNNG